MEQIAEQSIYEVLILDIDEGIRGVYELLRMCTEIHVAVIKEEVAQAKLFQFEEELHLMGYDDVKAEDGKKRAGRMRKMIEAEQLHARILSRLDMTRDMEDEELTELIYEVLQEASQEEYLPLDQKTCLERTFQCIPEIGSAAGISGRRTDHRDHDQRDARIYLLEKARKDHPVRQKILIQR